MHTHIYIYIYLHTYICTFIPEPFGSVAFFAAVHTMWRDWQEWGGDWWREWQGWGRQERWQWQQREAADPVAASAAGEEGGEARLRANLEADQERRNVGLHGAWAAWDARAFQQLLEEWPEAQEAAREAIAPSKRHTNLAKAFQNYRRQSLDRLRKAQFTAHAFKVWRVAASATHGESPTPGELLWNEENMLAFLDTHVTFRAMVTWRMKQTTRVKARSIPASLIDLWRAALVAKHTAWAEKYAADMDPNRFVRTPMAVWVEQTGERYEPTAAEAEAAVSAAAESPGAPYRLAEELETHLKAAFLEAGAGAARGEQPLAERLAGMVATGGVWTFVHEVSKKHYKGAFAGAATLQVLHQHFQVAWSTRLRDRRA